VGQYSWRLWIFGHPATLPKLGIIPHLYI
jgi:hypothetical protein